MCFKFLVKELKTDRTTTVRIRADREKIARQKLIRAGYQAIALVGVEAVKEARIQVQTGAKLKSLFPVFSGDERPSSLLRRRVRLKSLIADYLAPFNLLG